MSKVPHDLRVRPKRDDQLKPPVRELDIWLRRIERCIEFVVRMFLMLRGA